MTSARFPNPARAPLGRPRRPELVVGRRAALAVSKSSRAAGPWWTGWPSRDDEPANQSARPDWANFLFGSGLPPCAEGGLASEMIHAPIWQQLASPASIRKEMFLPNGDLGWPAKRPQWQVGATCIVTVPQGWPQGWPNHSSPRSLARLSAFPNPASFSRPTTCRIRRCPHRLTGVPVLLEPSGSEPDRKSPLGCHGWIQPIIRRLASQSSPVSSIKEPIRVQLPAMTKPRWAGRVVPLQ